MYLKHQADIEDATHDAFLAATKALSGFRGEAHITTYLFWCGHSAAMKIRKQQAYLPLEFAARTAMARGQTSNPEAVILHYERVDKVRRAVAKLPDKLREVVELRDMQEMTTEETAAHLGIAKGAVNMRGRRAHALLRERWA